MSIAQYLGDLMGRFSAHKAREDAKAEEAALVQGEVHLQNERYLAEIKLFETTREQ